jgi:hypothetical protein
MNFESIDLKTHRTLDHKEIQMPRHTQLKSVIAKNQNFQKKKNYQISSDQRL